MKEFFLYQILRNIYNNIDIHYSRFTHLTYAEYISLLEILVKRRLVDNIKFETDYNNNKIAYITSVRLTDKGNLFVINYKNHIIHTRQY